MFIFPTPYLLFLTPNIMNRIAHGFLSPLSFSHTTSNILLPSSLCFLHFVILFLYVHFISSVSSSLSDFNITFIHFHFHMSLSPVSSTIHIHYSFMVFFVSFILFCLSFLSLIFVLFSPYLLILTPQYNESLLMFLPLFSQPF
uniref:Uncharacterized protein n=1 Tax=Cacopsylla melanoneura TaxID=428564 RepID=A0A8D9EL47_9HEMI